MRILITGARAPVALELVRALGLAGHTVYAADSVAPTLAGASRYAAGRLVLPPPRYAPAAFVAALSAAVTRLAIELLIPTCEEIFYVAQGHAELSARARLLCEPLAELARWHHKGDFQRRAAALGLATPRTALVSSREDLLAQLPAFPRYILKPAYSRFATRVITNCGPYAARRPLAACAPTPAQPWLLQEFIEGAAVCSYSIVHGGHVTAHCAYVTPQTAGQGAGTAFVAVDRAATLAAASALAAAGFSGQLSLDFIRAPSGEHYLLECNPRATSGAHLIRRDRLVGALIDPQQATWVEPSGRQRQLSALALPAAAAWALGQPWRREGWRELIAAARAADVILADSDPLPALAQLALALRFVALSRRRGIGLIEATTDDIEWNGDADLPARAP
jgi:predicted ATP-grasp superfamily ATP-dependent carboligase